MPTRRTPRRAAAALALALTLGIPAGFAPRADAQATPPAAKEAPKRPANRLARETSPYLLLHAHNPVDWYPWGPEAFAKAKAEKKPVFLSIGYSSCYWCHVMERESFENPAIAKVLNANFVCVKVDREERPDVDSVYMAALQVFGPGGWPMSMFLTPEGRPFFGGTYFPPADRDGMEGFPSVLARVAEAWRDHRDELGRDAERLGAVVKRTLAASAARRRPLSRSMAAAGRAALGEQFDPEYGGFGYNPENARRPKFPEPVNLVFLLDQHRRQKQKAKDARGKAEGPSPLDMAATTFDHMARGGIRDQLAGGYHRYATSRYWIVPHFEKMLYDNAQLAAAHVQAYELTGDPRWKAEAEATFAFVARTMTAPEGGFYSALDAETAGEEGAYYVWTRDEVRSLLGDGKDADAFLQVYGLKRDPNFEKNRYVLLEPRTRAEQAATLKTTPAALEAALAPLRDRLLSAREKRPAPLRDDKVLTSWNGLMIAAYADGFRVLKDARYRDAAEKAADFLLAKLRTEDGRLLRTYRAGVAKVPGYLEDHAFLAHGLLRLHAATGDPKRLDQARALTDRMLADFADAADGGFFATSGDHDALFARPKDAGDNVLPSGNSVAVRNLVALGVLTKESKYLDAAGKTLESFSGTLAQSPSMMPLMLVALGEYLDARPDAEGPALADDDRDRDLLGPIGAGSRDVLLAQAELKAGDPAPVVTVTLTVKDGWHVYANPASADGLPPTRISVDPGQGWAVDKAEYPPGALKALAAAGAEKVSVYEGKVTVTVRLKPDDAADSVRADPVKLTVHYQACNDRACLAPAKRGVTVPLKPAP